MTEFDDAPDDSPSLEDSMPDEIIRLQQEIKPGSFTDFKEWMGKVDRALTRKCGMVSADLADVCFRDMFDAGTTPNDAADEVLENEGIELE